MLPCEIMSVAFQILNTFSLSLAYEIESTRGSNYTTVSSRPKREVGSNLRYSC